VFTLGSGTLTLGPDLTTNYGDAGNTGFAVAGGGTLVDTGTVSLDWAQLNADGDPQTIVFDPAVTIGGATIAGQFAAVDGTAVTFKGALSIYTRGTLDIEGDNAGDGGMLAATLTSYGSLIVGNGATAEIKAGFTNEAGASVLVSGLNTILQIDAGALLANSGTITLAQGGTLSVDTLNAASGTIAFADGENDALTVTSQTAYPVVTKIAGFVAGDTIDLAGLAWTASTSLIQNGNTLEINNGQHIVGKLVFANLSAIFSALTVADDGNGGAAGGADGIALTTTTPAPVAPAFDSATVSAATATPRIGASVQVALAFSAPVTVSGGTPTLLLNNGGTAYYTGGSGTATLDFTYGVAAGQTTPALALAGSGALQLNGASLTGPTGGMADVTGEDGAQPSASLPILGEGQISDFTGSGTSDILWSSASTGSVVEWQMSNGTPAGGAMLLADPAWAVAGSGDFTGGGTSGILWRNASTGTVVDWQMASGTVSAAATLLNDPAWTIAGTGDFNGDGKTDILWRNSSTGTVVDWEMNGFAPINAATLLSDPAWSVAGIGDFTGDGTDDILWRNAATGTVVEWLMNNGTVSSATALLSDPDWSIAGVGDFTGNGTDDILWRNASSGQVVEWLMKDGTVSSAASLLQDPNWTVAGVGDYTGNGTSDILWRNAGTGQTVEWLMKGGAPASGVSLISSTDWAPTGSLLLAG